MLGLTPMNRRTLVVVLGVVVVLVIALAVT